MTNTRTTTVILVLAAFLSTPLCCAPAVPFVPYPIFAGRYDVANESDETLYISPVAEIGRTPHFLVKSYSRFPYLPLFKRADIRLDPGESVRINAMVVPDLKFIRIAVRDRSGDYRQLKVDRPAAAHSLLMPETGYVIESFDGLYSIPAEDLGFASRGRHFNFRAGAAIVLGIIPLVLFFLALRLVWIRWKERRRARSEDLEDD